MSWADIQFKPAKKVLRQFAAAWLVIVLAWAVYFWFARGQQKVGWVLGALAVIVGGLGFMAPRAIRWVYLGCMIVAFPIGWVVSQIMLAMLFYCVVTPVAVFFRLRRRDLLRGAPPEECATFWTPKTLPEELRRYFRQY